MKVALEVWSSSYDQTEATCLRAEELGFDAFYYGESPHDLNLDCWTTLAALARATERIRLGPVITNVLPTYRSTTLLARQASTVDAIAGGRVDLRMGVGASVNAGRRWWEPFGIDYPDYDTRLDALIDALDTLPGLVAGLPIDLPSPPMSHQLPLTIAATGARAIRLAAERADVWETSFCTVDEFRQRDEDFEDLAAGRSVLRSLEIDGFISTTQPGVDDLVERIRHERGADEDLAPVFERALFGTPAQAARHVQRLEDAGVDQLVVALHDPHDVDALEALAEATNSLG